MRRRRPFTRPINTGSLGLFGVEYKQTRSPDLFECVACKEMVFVNETREHSEAHMRASAPKVEG